MSEQIIDLRSAWAILRRRGGTLVLAAAVGALAGGALAYVRPPIYTSTSIVLLPPSPQGSSNVPTHSIATQVQIANSEAVLGPAGKAVTPPLKAAQVDDRVEVVAPASETLSITATGTTRAQAESLAQAVANAEIDYLRAATSTLDEDAKSALSGRASTLKNSLAAVNSEIRNTQGRLREESPTSAAGRADAAALAELTAQQANVVLQIDAIEKETSAGSRPANGQASGSATVIQQASPAVSMPLGARMALYGGTGAAVVFLLTAILLVMRGRRENTLRSRDQIADAIGIPVVASIQSRAPRSVAGWTSLLQGYTPDSVEMWTLRQLLRLVTPGTPGSLVGAREDSSLPAKVVVVTLSDDLAALATAPQFASFAASTGTTTQLVTAQQHRSANALWAACSGLPADAQLRPGLSAGDWQDVSPSGDLIVYVAVVDRQRPDLFVHGADNAVTLLAVTSGAATADDLARVALAADDAGHPLARLVIVDPDPLDRTTGRLLPTERAQHVTLPSLMTGSAIAGEPAARETRWRFG